VSYGPVAAVAGLDLALPPRTIVGLVGANGAGKTSCLNAMTGLLPCRGSITLDGEPLAGRRPDEIVRRGVAQVAQGRQLFADMSVRENLEIGGFLHPAAFRRRQLEKLYADFPLLAERGQQAAGTLSGGEQQMLAIARALMTGPRMLLLDEPCLGLSPKMVLRVADIVRRLHAEGLAILLVEQNANFVFGLASMIFVMGTGRVTLSGTPDALRASDDVRRSYLGI